MEYSTARAVSYQLSALSYRSFARFFCMFRRNQSSLARGCLEVTDQSNGFGSLLRGLGV
ncbi:hypothetical protein SBA5_250056 [Candidatus Sulfotelmatomonas gaucii]|uniref:Uncharacterized protein n=1 Tax=Candidatus Sulfuritelmatomonas gaucii TaxID=2043161 RepID=A0A2N9L980_9BACT|nr:hypothetical protein SBA5_250056 [Candidatus Sulfotelmatomonas gaucii]